MGLTMKYIIMVLLLLSVASGVYFADEIEKFAHLDDIQRISAEIQTARKTGSVSVTDMASVRSTEVKQFVGVSVPVSGVISLEEFAKSKDVNAYQKMLSSRIEPQERTELDKLLNFLSRGRYE